MNFRLSPANPLTAFLLACVLAFAVLPPVVAQQNEPDQADDGTSSDRKPGITVIVEATGSVQVIEAPGKSPQPAQKGQRISEGSIVVTGPDGRVDLAFSNGAFMQIQENSRFGIGEFVQEGYEFVFSNGEAVRQKELEEFGADEAITSALDASEDAWNKLPQEPTVSTTKFNLEYGTMVGESKKLRPGSRMEVITPIGVAGIRGTTWRLTLQPVGGAGSNTFRGTLDVGRGLVNFSTSQGTRAVDVAGGFSMRVEASDTDGLVRINAIDTGRMTPERAAVLQQVTQSIQSIQTSFQAVQGTLGVLVNVLSAMSGSDVNSSQSVTDAALSVAAANPDQAQQVAQIISAVVLLQATPDNAPRVVADVVSALVSQSPQLASNIVTGVVTTATIGANNQSVPLSTSQAVVRAVVTAAISTAPAQAIPITNSGVAVATLRGNGDVAPSIASAVVGGSITAVPSISGQIASTAITAAINSGATTSNIQNVVSTLSNSAPLNAAYANLVNGGDQNSAAAAASEVSNSINQTLGQTQFANLAPTAPGAETISQTVNQANQLLENGQTPDVVVNPGGQGTDSPVGDTTGGVQVDTPTNLPGGQPPGGGTGNITPVQPQPSPSPVPSASPATTPPTTPTPTPSPTPSPTVSPLS